MGDLVLQTSRNALKLRYSLLKYYYTLFANLRGAGTIMRPLFFEFPEEENCYDETVQNEQFLIGSSLMVVPIIYQGQSTTNAYFPAGAWYDLLTGVAIQYASQSPAIRQVTNVLPAPTPVFIREGSAVYTQNTINITRSADLGDDFDLIVAVKKLDDGSYRADGVVSGCHVQDESTFYDLCVAQNCMVNMTITSPDDQGRFHLTFVPQDPNYTGFAGFNIQSFTVYGYSRKNISKKPFAILKNKEGNFANAMIKSVKDNKERNTVSVELFSMKIKDGYQLEIQL